MADTIQLILNIDTATGKASVKALSNEVSILKNKADQAKPALAAAGAGSKDFGDKAMQTKGAVAALGAAMGLISPQAQAIVMGLGNVSGALGGITKAAGLAGASIGVASVIGVALVITAGLWKHYADNVKEAEDRMKDAAKTATETAVAVNKVELTRAADKLRKGEITSGEAVAEIRAAGAQTPEALKAREQRERAEATLAAAEAANPLPATGETLEDYVPSADEQATMQARAARREAEVGGAKSALAAAQANEQKAIAESAKKQVDAITEEVKKEADANAKKSADEVARYQKEHADEIEKAFQANKFGPHGETETQAFASSQEPLSRDDTGINDIQGINVYASSSASDHAVKDIDEEAEGRRKAHADRMSELGQEIQFIAQMASAVASLISSIQTDFSDPNKPESEKKDHGGLKTGLGFAMMAAGAMLEFIPGVGTAVGTSLIVAGANTAEKGMAEQYKYNHGYAAGTDLITHRQLAYLDPGEMVPTATDSALIRSGKLPARFDKGESGGDTHIHHHYEINGPVGDAAFDSIIDKRLSRGYGPGGTAYSTGLTGGLRGS